MAVSFEQLKSMVVFAQVVEQGNFSAAAKHLGLTRAVVSYHIKKLETQSGLSLLNRSTRTMSLTEAGTAYYQGCRIIAEQAAFAQQQIENHKQEPVGLLKISCPVNVGLELIVPALNDFKRRYPKITLEVDLTDEVVNLIQDGVDLAIRGAPMVDSELQATRLTTLSTCLCAAPAYLEQQGRPASPAELSRHQWVMYKPAGKLLTLSKGQRSYAITMTGDIATNNAAARTAFLVGGHGLGRIPLYDARPKLDAGRLERILEDYQLKDIELYGVFPPGGAGSKKLRLVVDFLKGHFDRLNKDRRLAGVLES